MLTVLARRQGDRRRTIAGWLWLSSTTWVSSRHLPSCSSEDCDVCKLSCVHQLNVHSQHRLACTIGKALCYSVDGKHACVGPIPQPQVASPSPSSHHPANISNSSLRAIGAPAPLPLKLVAAKLSCVPAAAPATPWLVLLVPGVIGSDRELLLLLARCTAGMSRTMPRGRVIGPTSSCPMQRHTAHRQ